MPYMRLKMHLAYVLNDSWKHLKRISDTFKRYLGPELYRK